MICFDDIDAWSGSLAEVLLPIAPRDIQLKLQAAKLRYIEDATDLFLHFTYFDAVVDLMLCWVRSNDVSGYHGTRLTVAEVESIKAEGLVPLRATSRDIRLRRALSKHPRWPEVAGRLGETIQLVGPGGKVGQREGQVHLTLSRAGLTEGFNHYLTHGAEFDLRVAEELLGEEGKDLLTKDGDPYVIQVAVPGTAALAATHPFFTVEDVRGKGEVPNLIREFLTAFCFRLSRPEYQSRNLQVDCGMIFRSTVPAKWIRQIEPWVESGGREEKSS